MGRVGLEHPQLVLPKTAFLADSGAKSGAHAVNRPIQDPDVIKIIATWPTLPDYVKTIIKTLIEKTR